MQKLSQSTRRIQRLAMMGTVVLALLVAGCSDRPEEGVSEALPCDPARQQVDLGNPRRSTLPAEVTLSGATIWGKLKNVTGGGGFMPVTDQAALWAGPIDNPPIFEPGASTPLNTDVMLTLHVGLYTEIALESGRYWVMQSQGGNLELFACETGTMSDALGVPLRPEGLALVPAEIIESSK